MPEPEERPAADLTSATSDDDVINVVERKRVRVLLGRPGSSSLAEYFRDLEATPNKLQQLTATAELSRTSRESFIVSIGVLGAAVLTFAPFLLGTGPGPVQAFALNVGTALAFFWLLPHLNAFHHSDKRRMLLGALWSVGTLSIGGAILTSSEFVRELLIELGSSMVLLGTCDVVISRWRDSLDRRATQLSAEIAQLEVEARSAAIERALLLSRWLHERFGADYQIHRAPFKIAIVVPTELTSEEQAALARLVVDVEGDKGITLITGLEDAALSDELDDWRQRVES